VAVPATDRPADRGRRLGARIGFELGEQLRLARVAAGLSQLEVARACGSSRAGIGRLERGERRSAGLLELSTALAVVGLELSARAYPSGRPHRDSAHLALLGRLRNRLPEDIGWRAEVPFPQPGDLRAWDAMVRPKRLRVAIEAETRPRDGQELQRRLARKLEDGQVDRLILLLPDTRSNRMFLRDFGPSLAADFPVPGRRVLECLERGDDPRGNAIIRL
jgi:transcriptional regulator with XRE-family HTH domain